MKFTMLKHRLILLIAILCSVFLSSVTANVTKRHQLRRRELQEEEMTITTEAVTATVPPEEQEISIVMESLQQAATKEEASKLPDDAACKIRDVQEKTVPATFTASYPGSGAKITWRLIRAITGIYTGDDHDHNGRVSAGHAVAVKTHYPSHAPPKLFEESEPLKRIEQAILLIRNPLNALPSFHNYIYEQLNGLMNHSTRAPVQAWVDWRNKHFETEIGNWVNHTKWWIEHFPEKRLLLLPYEKLTSAQWGPETLQQVGHYLGRVHPLIRQSLVTDSQYKCIFELLVQDGHIPGEKERRKSHRQGGPRGEYPYTNVQLEYMIQTLVQLRDEYQQKFPQLYQLLQQYLAEIVERKKQVEYLMRQGGAA
jgi:hypothetical protein